MSNSAWSGASLKTVYHKEITLMYGSGVYKRCTEKHTQKNEVTSAHRVWTAPSGHSPTRSSPRCFDSSISSIAALSQTMTITLSSAEPGRDVMLAARWLACSRAVTF
jgi:hypothetical protein